MEAGFAATGLELAYLVMHAEISGKLASGSPVHSPGSALTQTHAHFDERVPAGPAVPPTRQEVNHWLVRRYFASRGPATIKDCAEWSGLTMADVRTGLQLALDTGPEALAARVIDGVEHYFDAGTDAVVNSAPGTEARIDLIQCYDEYVMGYSATRHYLGGIAPAFPAPGAPMHVVLLDGRMAGSWRHTFYPDRCELDIRLFNAAQQDGTGNRSDYGVVQDAVQDSFRGEIQDAVDRYAAFLGTPAAWVRSGVKLEGHI